MIHLFRRIRQQLIGEGKTAKYLKYAIGEIVLVVVGILIALSINSWNEYKKNREFESEMLMQIDENLIKDKHSLEKIRSNYNNAIKSSNKLLEGNWTEQENDSLKYWLGDIIQFERFQPLTNAYEVVKSKGLEHIQNKQLRFLIGKYYDDEVSHMIKSIGDIEVTFNRDWIPILKTGVESFKFQDYVDVKDFGVFQNNTPGRNLLILNLDNFRGGVNRISNVIKTTDKIHELITIELKK